MKPTRLRTWWQRARSAPAGVEHVVAQQDRLGADLGSLSSRLTRVEASVAQLAELVTQLADLVTAIRQEDLQARAAARADQTYTLRTAEAAAQDTLTNALLDSLGEPSPRRSGLSVTIVSWQHAGFLGDAIRSGLAVLDRISPEPRGEVLILDNGSTDETPSVLAAARGDARVRAIRVPRNVGLTRGRNVLLRACTTTHALMLDADNRADPDGGAVLFDAARRVGAAFTYGNLVMADGSGEILDVASQEPLTSACLFLGGPHIDTFAVVDVETVERVGGYSTDPGFNEIEDHEIIHRLCRHGELFAFVPMIVGYYRVDPLGRGLSSPDHAASIARLRRQYDQDGRLSGTEPRAVAIHPELGVIWASQSAGLLDDAPPPGTADRD